MLRTLILAAFVLALAGCGGGSSSAPAPKSEPPAPAAKAAAPTTAPPTAAAKAAAPTSAPAATLAPAAQVEAVALGEPRDRLLGVHPFQCPECATLHTEGVIDDERETRYLAGSRQRRYCCDAHGRAWRRRQAATVERGKLSA